MPKSEGIRELIISSAVLFGFYVLAYFLVWSVIVPWQAILLPNVTAFAFFFFLPHGVRVIATSVMGSRAIPALVLADGCGNYLFWGITEPSLLIAVSLVGGAMTWVGFQVLCTLGVNPFYLDPAEKTPPLATLLLAGLQTSILNGFVLTAILERSMEIGGVWQVLAAYVLGDMTGLLVVIVLLKSTLRLFGVKSEN